MSSGERELYFGIGLDNSALKSDVEKSMQLLKRVGDSADIEGKRLDAAFRRATQAAVGFFTIHQAKAFISDVIRIRSEIQMLEKSFEVLLGSKLKSDAMIAEIRELATKSPLEMSQVSNAAQTLLGFGVDAGKVMGALGQLSDVSMGNADRFRALALAYAQVQGTGKLMGQDLLQMINAGFNPLQTMSEKTGKSMAQLKEEMSQGAISAEMVADAFAAVTSEGGKFYGMTQKQAEGLAGLKANFQDAITTMYNEIGESNDGIIANGMKMATSLVENYDKIGKALIALVAGLGSYKAALVAVHVTQKAVAASGNIQAWFELAKGIRTAKDAQVALNLAMGANPIIKIVSILIAAGTALYLFSRRSKSAAEELNGLAKATKAASEEFGKEEAKIKTLNSVIENSKVSYSERKRALEEIKRIIPGYNAELDKEGKIINNNTSAIKEYLVQLEKQIKLKAAKEELEEAYMKKRQQEKAVKLAEENLNKVKKQTPQNIQEMGYGEAGIISTKNTLDAAANAEKVLTDANKALGETISTITELNTEIEGTSTLTDKTGLSITTFSEQLIEAQSNVKNLKQEIQDIRSGSVKVDDPARIIEEKTKALKEAEDRVALLTDAPKTKTERAAKPKDYTDQITEEFKERERAEKDFTHSLEQLQVDLMEEGLTKVLSQNELNYQKELEQIHRQKEDKLRQIQEWERTIWESENAGWEKKGHTFSPATTVLSQVDQDSFKEIEDGILKKWESSNDDAIKRLLGKYQTYGDKRKEIEEKFNKDIESMRKLGGSEGGIKEAEKEMSKALAELDNSVMESTSLMVQLFEDASLKSVKEIDLILDKSKEVLEYIKSVKSDDIRAGFGFSEDQLRQLKEDPEKLKAYTDAIRRLESEIGQKSPFKKLAIEIKEGLELMKKASQEGGNGLDDIAKGAINIQAGFSAALPAIQDFGNDLSKIFGGDLGDKIAQVTEMVGASVNLGTGIAKIVSGDMSGIVDAIKGIASISKYFSSSRKIKAELAKKTAEYQQKELLGEIEVSSEYRKRYEWAQKIGESTLDNIKRQGEELKKQSSSRESDYKRLIELINKESYISGVSEKKNWIGHKWTSNDYAALEGKDFEEIKVLAAQGKLTEQAMAIFEKLQDLEEQGLDIAKMQEEFWEETRQLTTGSTYDSVVNSIVEGFKAGKRSAADFAESFDQLMQNAVGSALSLLTNQKMRTWYDNFAIVGEDGYTDAEISNARDDYLRLIESLARDAEAMEKVTGVTIGNAQREAMAKGFASMSQDSADELNGRFTTMQGHTFSISEGMKIVTANSAAILNQVAGIKQDTIRLTAIEQNMTAMKASLGNIETRGITLRQ